MNPESNDPILERLRDLPVPPLDDAAVGRVRWRAQAALAGERRLPVRMVRVWTGSVLPALLVAAGLMYAWRSLTWMESIYVADRAVASR
jgi:hypothetical protein